MQQLALSTWRWIAAFENWKRETLKRPFPRPASASALSACCRAKIRPGRRAKQKITKEREQQSVNQQCRLRMDAENNVESEPGYRQPSRPVAAPEQVDATQNRDEAGNQSPDDILLHGPHPSQLGRVHCRPDDSSRQ